MSLNFFSSSSAFPFPLPPNLSTLLNSMQPLPFHGVYKVYPVVMANKATLEAGDKIILPPSALDALARLRVTYPMLFSLTPRHSASSSQRGTHVGVMEFSAEEGVAYVPYWIMQHLLLESGSIVDVHNVTLPKGTFVQFQPHHTAFTMLHNPRAVLERALRGFSCLTQGDTIAIQHGEQNFLLDVTQVKPGNAVSIIETDVNVDFAPPKDYQQYEQKHQDQSSRRQTDESESKEPRFVFSAGQDAAQSPFFAHDGKGEVESGQSVDPEAAHKAVEEARARSGGSEYFAKLGQGHRLKEKFSASSSSTPSPSIPFTSSSTSDPIAESKSTAHSAVLPEPSKTVSETIGQWTYIYAVDAHGQKKLTRRLPAKKDSSSSDNKEKGSVFQKSTGYNLC